jgi:hypothetical protein
MQLCRPLVSSLLLALAPLGAQVPARPPAAEAKAPGKGLDKTPAPDPAPAPSRARIDLAVLAQQLQGIRQDQGLQMVLWMPDEFWTASLRQTGNLSDKAIAEVLKPLADYTILAVVDGRLSALGSMEYATAQSIREGTRIHDAEGHAYAPLEEADLSRGFLEIRDQLQPVLAKMLGPLGANMQCLAFPRLDRAGRPIALATGTGRFHIKLQDTHFHLRLPIAALATDRTCRQDGEAFPSNYRFCPYDGTPLP